MVAIVDYGVGNLFSLKCSLDYIGAQAVITSEAAVLDAADAVILPGVGAFRDAAEKLKAGGLDRAVIRNAASGKPLLGICLGMQMLFDKSYEYGEYAGLGLIPGEIVPLRGYVPDSLKIPQIGWNALRFTSENCQLFRYIKDGECVYFVHSYYAACDGDYRIAETEYGAPVTAAAAKDNVFGCQFHPEKSGEVGLNILRAFCEMR